LSFDYARERDFRSWWELRQRVAQLVFGPISVRELGNPQRDRRSEIMGRSV
jgi:hypothetical protein